MNSRGFRSQLDVFLGPKLNLNQNLTWVTICAYTINLKSKCATPKFQLFPTFFAFSESAHQTEWEYAQGAMKSRKKPKMGHPIAGVNIPLSSKNLAFHFQLQF